MTVDNRDYDGYVAFRRMWKAALAALPAVPLTTDNQEPKP